MSRLGGRLGGRLGDSEAEEYRIALRMAESGDFDVKTAWYRLSIPLTELQVHREHDISYYSWHNHSDCGDSSRFISDYPLHLLLVQDYVTPVRCTVIHNTMYTIEDKKLVYLNLDHPNIEWKPVSSSPLFIRHTAHP
ncbi:uncharacterized protein [Spinacia oleracea]|uniref:Uncharacterized protein n=1 Tax=Spinacia oleracea TaxID=3562 RepID=A0A9R0HX16_SPIOL|nr:uncharacterized protein LOC110778224 [Spinacia oleracea]